MKAWIGNQAVSRRTVFGRILAFFLSLILLVGTPMVAWADVPESFRIPPWPGHEAGASPVVQTSDQSALRLLVDTDLGVDDAAALIWLLSQHRYPLELLGVVTVAGNTTVENATNNVLLLLSLLERNDIPVVMGAHKPSNVLLSSTGKLIHGPDGLWFLGAQNPQEVDAVDRKAARFYCDMARTEPGAVVLALGPLTNLAQALRRCPADMANLGRLVVLGGAKFGGNTTPVSEYNFWQDPAAAAEVLQSGLPITLVPMDAFGQFSLSMADVASLQQDGVPAIQFLAPALQAYLGVQLQSGSAAVVPDPVAAMVALDPSLATLHSALVKVLDRPEVARGQSLIALSFAERITLIADDRELSQIADQVFSDPGFDYLAAVGAILQREPDNALVAMDVDAAALYQMFMDDLSQSVSASGAAEHEPSPIQLFLPSVQSR
uniref:Nucleoside hydrolase n=2 Tax=Litorilinea aerophila TaxID=1204385 RepID=A0A540VJG2_9CHLR